jgi:GT2 family glycosyltransferase
MRDYRGRDLAGVEMFLRLVACGARIQHIPKILYHSYALGYDSVLVSLSDEIRHGIAKYLAATGQDATVQPGPVPGTHRIRWAIKAQPRVSIIIPSRCQPPKGGGVPYVVKCVESIAAKSTYKAYEILVLDRNEMPPEMEARFKELGVRRVTYSEPFNWSRVNNLGAKHAAGSHLLFLNDDMEIITPDWLECMLEYSQQAAIGAVGAKLFFPDGTLQHVGVTISDGNPGHPFYGAPGDDPGYFFSNVVPRNWCAVTGACLMTRAEVFREAGGFNEEFNLNYNDVDYCLKVRRAGKRVVCTPYAQLLHYESVSKPGTFPEELARFRKHWPEWCARDPFFSIHALEFADA